MLSQFIQYCQLFLLQSGSICSLPLLHQLILDLAGEGYPAAVNRGPGQPQHGEHPALGVVARLPSGQLWGRAAGQRNDVRAAARPFNLIGSAYIGDRGRDFQ